MARNAQPDLTEFAAFKRTCGTPPKLPQIRQALTPDDLAKFDAALAEHSIPINSIKAWLAKKGHKISASTLRNWRHDLAS